jgi:hypothetical protein
MLASLSLVVLALVPCSSPAAAQAGAHAGRVVLAAERPRSDGGTTGAAASAGTVLVTVDPARPAAGGAASTAGVLEFVATRAAASDAEDRALAGALSRASAIEMRGGTWIGWYQAAHSGRHEREWTRALRRAHALGAEVRASGGAAAWIAQWSAVPRSALDKPAQDPHDTSLDLQVEGLGLFEGPLVGVLTPDAPTADRVVERALAFGYRDVLLLAGDAEFEWEPATHSARIRIPPQASGAGPGWVAWIDLGAGRRSRGVVRGARATFPRDGDVFAARSRVLDSSEPLLGDPREDAGVARLLDELGRARGSSAWIKNLGAGRDENTVRSGRGGLGGVAIDLELQIP